MKETERFILTSLTLSFIFLFTIGFFDFPNASIYPKTNQIPNWIRNFECPALDQIEHEKKETKLVFLLVDAFANHFLLERKSMQRLQGLINDGHFFKAKSFSSYPTFTLPGMKRLFTGRKAIFWDSIINLQETAIPGETLFSKLKEANRTTVAFADHLIMSWFPNDLSNNKSKETTDSSLNRKYNEADNKTIVEALKFLNQDVSKEWDNLLVYFYGLDAAGHFLNTDAGPHIESKLEELDKAINDIYKQLLSQESKFILIVTGDHGMNSNGNHGGSEASVTDSIFLFASSDHNFKSHRRKIVIDQMDITATITSLLNVPLPSQSLGVSFAHLLTGDVIEAGYNLINNAVQLRQLNSHTLDNKELLNDVINKLTEQTKKLCSDQNIELEKDLIENCYQTLKRVQKPLLSVTSAPNMYLIAFAYLVYLIIIYYFVANLHSRVNIFYHILIAGIPLLFYSSSFIDEVPDIMFFILQSLFVLTLHSKRDLFIIMGTNTVCHSLMAHTRRRYTTPLQLTDSHERWPQSLIMPDFNEYLQSHKYPQLTLILATILVISLYNSVFYKFKKDKWFKHYSLSFILIFIIKLAGSIPYQAKIILFTYVIFVLFKISFKQKLLVIFLTCFLFTPNHLTLILIVECLFIFKFMSIDLPNQEKAVLLTFITESFFFNKGNLYTFSSINLAVPYDILVENAGALFDSLPIIYHTFSSYFIINGCLRYFAEEKRIINQEEFFNYLNYYQILFRMQMLFHSSLACLVFQNHLMIWSTFAPKYIFDAVQFVVTMILVN